jgi:hypothetical protein
MSLSKGNQLAGVEKKVTKKAKHILRASKIWWMHFYQPDEPYRYIFHHIPKCGGTSALDALTHWFICIKDYPPAWGNLDNPQAYQRFCQNPKNFKKLHHNHILCGHYHLPGSFIFERYPQCFKEDKYRLITFLRHPLQVQLSLHYYELRNQRNSSHNSIEKRLLERQNYLASVIPCNKSNYQEILNCYFFIGLVEEFQESFDRLADLLDKPRIELSILNQSPRKEKKLSQEFISEFKELNQLDFKIYNYVKMLYKYSAYENYSIRD